MDRPTAPWLTARTGAPKGFAPYNPRAAWKRGVVCDVLTLFNDLADDDALPVGPRTSGYALSQRVNASGLRYVKYFPGNHDLEHSNGVVSFRAVEDVIKRLRQAGELEWEWVSDGSAVSYPVPEDTTAEGFAARVLDGYEHDLREGQPVVVEIHSESAELTRFIERVAAPYGVRVESGRGSAGPDLARRVAIRVWNRYWTTGQRTLLLGDGDLDLAGVRNVMRPHVEHIAAFLRGFAEQQKLADPNGVVERMFDFKRVAVTVEQAVGLEVPGVNRDALIAYRDSGDDDWTRDVQLLTEKVEVEALGPQRLREAITAAIEEALDLDVLEQARAAEQREAGRLEEMRQRLEFGDVGE